MTKFVLLFLTFTSLSFAQGIEIKRYQCGPIELEFLNLPSYGSYVRYAAAATLRENILIKAPNENGVIEELGSMPGTQYELRHVRCSPNIYCIGHLYSVQKFLTEIPANTNSTLVFDMSGNPQWNIYALRIELIRKDPSVVFEKRDVVFDEPCIKKF